jgi:putative PIN family toxin of toxin-antitoxin system
MRVVLDTNVLIAAFIARGVCVDVFERVMTEHELLLSPHILGEFKRVMTEKLRLDTNRVQRALEILRRVGHISEPEPLTSPVARDPDDDPVLALAVSADAACLVTGDDDLLVLGSIESIPIITPRAFLTFGPAASDD